MKQTKEFEQLGVKITVETSEHRNIDTPANVSTRATDLDSVAIANRLNAAGKYGEFIPMGGTTVARKNEDGTFAVVEDNDPIVQGILNKGALYNAHLFRQHILAQMMHQMAGGEKAYNKYVNEKLNYEYMLRTIGDELKRLEAQYRQKDEWANVTKHFFNPTLVCAVVADYICRTLPEQIKRLEVHKCQKREYVIIPGLKRVWSHTDRNMIFLSDLGVHVYSKYEKILAKIKNAHNPIELNAAYKEFMEKRIPVVGGYRKKELAWNREIHKFEEVTRWIHVETTEVWRDTYKGYGAWWSMQNLIEFHGCKLHRNGKALDRAESMRCLKDTLKEDVSGWWLLGMLRHLMKDNGIDPKQMIASWRK